MVSKEAAVMAESTYTADSSVQQYVRHSKEFKLQVKEMGRRMQAKYSRAELGVKQAGPPGCRAGEW